MEIEAAQYASMEMIGLLVIDDGPWRLLSARLASIGDEWAPAGSVLVEYSCLFLSSIVVCRSRESDTKGILQCGRANTGMRLRRL